MQKAVHFFNGKLVSEEELLLSPRDLGFARGYAVFDFLITYPHHRPFKLKEHIDRLFNSAEAISLRIPWSKKQIMTWIKQTLDANKSKEEKMIKVIISGGVSDSLLPKQKEPTIIIIVDPRHLYPTSFYTKGIGMITVKHHRYAPHAKTNNYIEGVKQSQEAEKIDAVEPIYYDDSQVFEGATSNIFAVINGILKTPGSHILPGITRNTVLESLVLSLPVVVEDFTIEDLRRAEEVFLTGSNREITPITRIDGKKVGNGSVGVITKEVMEQFRLYTHSKNW